MTLNELKYVVAVARLRHFGRAAESCFVSQPTLSVAVKKLEDELGVILFERGQGEVNVTPVGERVVTQAQRVLEEAGGIREIANQGKDQLQAPLRLGAIYTVGPYLLPQLIPLLAERAPRMPLIVEENYTAVLTEKLKHGELDLILISLPFEVQGLMTQALYDEPFVVLLPSSHPWSQEDRVSPRELPHENVLLLGEGHCFRDQVLQVCPECIQNSTEGGHLQRSLQGSSLETIRYMVASGLGITVLPCTAARADRFSERLVTIRRFDGQPPHRRVALAWRKSFPRPRALEAVRKAILDSGLSGVTPVAGAENAPQLHNGRHP